MMNQLTTNPYEPVVIDGGKDAYPRPRQRSLLVRFVCLTLWLFGGFSTAVGLVPLMYVVGWAFGVGGRPPQLLYPGAAILLYLGTGVSLCAAGVFIYTGEARRAIFSALIAVAIPVTLFSLLGF